MHILIGLLLALALLYWWLIGHWFARVVMLFPAAVVLGAMGVWMGASIPQKAPTAAANEPWKLYVPAPATVANHVSGGLVHPSDAGLFDAPAAPPATAAPRQLSDADVFRGEHGYAFAAPDPAPAAPIAAPAAQPAVYLEVLGGMMGLVAAWFVSGLPIYYHRRRAHDARSFP